MRNETDAAATTSTWSSLARVVRRSSMPVAWVVTLGVCAGSAFAVRDVVFPSLSPSATPSLWQPKESDTTVSSGGGTTSPDRIDVDRTDISTVIVGVTATTTETTAVRQASAGPTYAGSGRPARHSDDTATTATSSPSASSPGTTAPGGGQHPGTTVPKSTTTTGPDTSSTVSQTTNPATSDTLPDDSGNGSSGPGRSGHTNDTLP